MSDFDHQRWKHFKTGATGRLYVGEGKGYDNRVLELTVNELQFPNSLSTDRFMDTQRRKYANTNDLKRQRRMKLQSISSD
jgi:hypothetical protein